jgi:hypothetical protein
MEETDEPEDLDEHQANSLRAGDGTSSSQPINIPPPLNVPPSRARRLFAARVAARKKEAEEAAELDAAAAKQVEHSQSNYSKSHGRTASSGGLDDPRSDDSLDGSEDVGIVMRKSVRSVPARLGKSIFTLDGSGDDEEEDEEDDEDEDEEDEEEGRQDMDADIVAELEKLGIDVRTPPGVEDEVD